MVCLSVVETRMIKLAFVCLSNGHIPNEENNLVCSVVPWWFHPNAITFYSINSALLKYECAFGEYCISNVVMMD